MVNGLFSHKLTKRILSALVMAPISLFAIWSGGTVFLIFVALCASLSFHEWGQLSLKTQHKIPYLIVGFFYVSIAFYACFLIREEFSVLAALLFVGMVWLSDSGAYFVGKALKGPKLAKDISPNKTWAGLGGAIIAPAAFCLVVLAFSPSLSSPNLSATDVIMAAICGMVFGIIGQIGDLIISMLKRQAGAKDTGQLIPGHGGLLDRVDSMMLLAPVFLFMLVKFHDVLST